MGISWKRFFNLVAFVAVVLVGIALMLSALKIGSNIQTAFGLIAEILAYLVVAFYSFFYAWSRTRKRWTGQLLHLIIWTVAVVLIIVFIIIR